MKQRWWLVFVVAQGLLLALAGCSLLGGSAALKGTVHIAGSTALQPLLLQAANDFHNQHPQVTVDVQGGGSFAGLDLLYQQKVDVAASDGYVKLSQYPDRNVTDYLVAASVFAMILNPANPLINLTSDQIVGIYTGHLTNWRQLGGPNLPIIPLARPTTSGTRAAFEKYVLQTTQNESLVQLVDGSQEMVQTVAQQPGAIGYVALTNVTPQVHAVALDSISPSLDNVLKGTYAFWSYEHLYTRGIPAGVVRAFLDFLLTDAEQRQASRLGYLPAGAIHSLQSHSAPLQA